MVNVHSNLNGNASFNRRKNYKSQSNKKKRDEISEILQGQERFAALEGHGGLGVFRRTEAEQRT